MARRAGSADLPLHGGRVPKWLGDRMTRLGAIISEAIVLEYGRDELLRRLAHPFWFQSFGAVMGMDWHSSGIITSVIGALKRGLTPLSGELGIHVCGGRGKHSRQTPHELTAIGDRVGLDGAALGKVSRLVAKVDSAAVPGFLASVECVVDELLEDDQRPVLGLVPGLRDQLLAAAEIEQPAGAERGSLQGARVALRRGGHGRQVYGVSHGRRLKLHFHTGLSKCLRLAVGGDLSLIHFHREHGTSVRHCAQRVCWQRLALPLAVFAPKLQNF
jgi:Protein of unknown function (DUF763)